MEKENKKKIKGNVFRKKRWLLVFYDVVIFAIVSFFMLVVSNANLSIDQLFLHTGVALFSILLFRFIWRVYEQMWRYGGIQSYIRLIGSDACALVVYFVASRTTPMRNIEFVRMFSLISFDLLVCLTYRMLYRWVYKRVKRTTKFGKFIFKCINFFGRSHINLETEECPEKIKIAIVGAGRIGVGLAEELINNSQSNYVPRLFIDIDKEKIGRQILGIKVHNEEEATLDLLKHYEIQEVVFALPQVNQDIKKELYNRYKEAGFKIKTYDYPTIQNADGKRHLREFDIEELLFRNPIEVIDDKTSSFYKDKVILITGGGGSIGSELCRQIARMSPRKIIILDVYENGAYDVQQELKIKYKEKLDLQVEILSICNKVALERVFKEYKPNIVIMAAAHKHVPLMEHNVIEAVENNIFGTINTVELSEKYGVDRVMMVSTDKAVNPTNVMGATKRFCEIICQARSKVSTHTTYSATRFGNVLGSAGSVIPLFKRQIAAGGPVTLTHKEIIRYFMTIPEASQLVLCSGAMAKNGELFVLDMGKPVKILQLAESMIKLSGYIPYKDIDIVETGLRPGEKLYEELLIKTEKLDKTDNSLIFIEKDESLSMDELNKRINILKDAIATNSDEVVKEAMHQVVPTFVCKPKDDSKSF